MVRRLVGFVVAALVMIVLGSIAHSLLVQQAWADAGCFAATTRCSALPAVISLGSCALICINPFTRPTTPPD